MISLLRCRDSGNGMVGVNHKGVFMTVVQGTTDSSGIQFSPDSGHENGIPVSSLATLTGFSEEFIKDELLLTNGDVSINELRAKMLLYLKKNFNS